MGPEMAEARINVHAIELVVVVVVCSSKCLNSTQNKESYL